MKTGRLGKERNDESLSLGYDIWHFSSCFKGCGFSKTIKEPTQWVPISLDIHASTCRLSYSSANQRSRSNCVLLMIPCPDAGLNEYSSIDSLIDSPWGTTY